MEASRFKNWSSFRRRLQSDARSNSRERKLKKAKQVAAVAAFIVSIIPACGCKQQQSDADAIRAGITQHLTSLNTLNLSAMDMDVNGVAIQGRQAHAQVPFRPKTGGPPG